MAGPLKLLEPVESPTFQILDPKFTVKPIIKYFEERNTAYQLLLGSWETGGW